MRKYDLLDELRTALKKAKGLLMTWLIIMVYVVLAAFVLTRAIQELTK